MAAAKMTPERWTRVKEVMQAALELPPAERPAYLDFACGDDTELHEEVHSLLAANDDAGEFLEEPATLPEVADEEHLPAGTRLGLYQIVQLIGEGGMGAVYQALREDIRKLVAVKVVKSGLHSEFLLTRFANERQILAHFNHPYITKFLDSGLTPEGQPYFVMEFVGGQQIDEYCDGKHLNTRARLELFLKVCSGVAYAHRNLVVHRDLKPRNILITAEGDPKLLDFGIAKIMEEDPVTGNIHATVTVVRMMTPEYASPEQARGEPVSTSSDVYSLGVLLYELLTGHSPYRIRGRSVHQAAEVICKSLPALPSAVVRRTDAAETAAGQAITPESVSATREARPERLVRALAGDLDNIVMKALEKAPEQRYSSVEQLADDIHRHLDGRPVRARAASWRYRSAKFVGRHKAGVAAAALIAITLVGGVAATLREARIATLQRARAERRFQDVRSLANSLMFEMYDAIQNLPGSTGPRELLVNRALKYLDSLSAESAGDTGLKRELAEAYERVGDVQGGYRSANLGNFTGATDSYRKALALREAVAGANPADDALDRDLVRNNGKLSDVLMYTGKNGEAMERSRKLLSIAESLAARNPKSLQDQSNLASAYLDAGFKQTANGDWQSGLTSMRQSIALGEALVRQYPEDTNTKRRLVIAYERTAFGIASYSDRYAEALALHRKQLALAQQLSGAAPLDAPAQRLAAYAHIDIGEVFSLTGEFAAARTEFAQSLEVLQKLSAADPRNVQYQLDVISAQGLEANATLDEGKTALGMSQVQATLQLLAKVPESSDRSVFLATNQYRMGKAHYLAAAGRRGMDAASRQEFTEAKNWYGLGLAGLERAQAQGIVDRHDAKLIEQARKGMENCDRALAAPSH